MICGYMPASPPTVYRPIGCRFTWILLPVW